MNWRGIEIPTHDEAEALLAQAVAKANGGDAWRIGTDRVPMAERVYLYENCFVHFWLNSDPESHHDHPWHYVSMILRNGYWESTPNGRTFVAAGSILCRDAHSPGRVTRRGGAPRFVDAA